MKNYFASRFRPNYIRAITYMLQTTEYNIREYLKWLHHTSNFNKVENRKNLKLTKKAILLLTTATIIWLSILIIASYIAIASNQSHKLIIAISLALLSPIILSYTIIIPLSLFQITIQKIIEFAIINKAKKAIKNHKALKIAIAGSYGKTTMREILKTTLSEGKTVAAPPHNHNTPLGISKFTKTLTGKEEVLIFELGEYYKGDIEKLCKLTTPDIGIITGINEAHLEKFKTLKNTTNTIFELSDNLKNKPLYINGENALVKTNAKPIHKIYTRNKIENWKIQGIKTTTKGTSFKLITETTTLKLKSKLLGLHQVGPLATAAKIAHELNLSPQQIKAGIAKTKPYNHRLEPKQLQNGAILLDDSYNGNPDGVKAVIEFLTSQKNHRRFYMTPGLVEMGKRTIEVHKKIGKQLAKSKIEKVILIKNSVTPLIEQGLKENNFTGEIIWYQNAKTALKAIQNITANKDIILIQNDWPDQYN